jgi:autoinducer 2 (AI-2) kinase
MKTNDPYIAVIDFGSSSGRCLLIDPKGTVVASSQETWKYQETKHEGEILWSFDPGQFWSILAACCKKSVITAGIDAHDVIGVIATSQRHGVVLMDPNGVPFDAIPNNDVRSTPEWKMKVDENAQQIYDITFRWPQPIFLPAHLDWFRIHRPNEYYRIGHLLSILDWIVYCFCGEIVSEPTAAADLLLLDIQKQQWSHDLLELFNFSPDWMPSIVPSGSVVGKISPSAALITGLPEGIPVLIGGADTQLGVLGLGCSLPNSIAIIMGSSIPLQMVSEKPIKHPSASTWTNPHVIPNQWVIESNAGDAGLQQNNMVKKIIEETVRTNLELDTHQFLVKLDGMVMARRKIRKSNLLASVGTMVFNGKNWPEIQGMIKGIDLNRSLDIGWIDLYEALVDNIAYAIKGNYLQLREMSNTCPYVCAGGGTLNSKMWQTLLPNVLGSKINIPKEKEVTSIGAALLAFVSLGVYQSHAEAKHSMVHLEPFDGFQIEMVGYERRYQEWLDLYQMSIRKN